MFGFAHADGIVAETYMPGDDANDDDDSDGLTVSIAAPTTETDGCIRQEAAQLPIPFQGSLIAAVSDVTRSIMAGRWWGRGGLLVESLGRIDG